MILGYKACSNNRIPGLPKSRFPRGFVVAHLVNLASCEHDFSTSTGTRYNGIGYFVNLVFVIFSLFCLSLKVTLSNLRKNLIRAASILCLSPDLV
jgi:hypothetical protein